MAANPTRALGGAGVPWTRLQSVQIIMLLYLVHIYMRTQMVCVCAGDIFVAQPWAPARQVSAGRLPQALHGVA